MAKSECPELGEHIRSFGASYKLHLYLVLAAVFAICVYIYFVQKIELTEVIIWAVYLLIFPLAFIAFMFMVSRFSKLHVYERGIKGPSTFGSKKIPWKDIDRIHSFRMPTPQQIVYNAREVVFESKHLKKDINISYAIFKDEHLQKIIKEKIPEIVPEINPRM